MLSLQRLLLVLRARWALALAIVLLVLAATLAVTLALPQRYTASAAVVLDVKSPDPVAGVLLPGMTVSGYMGTQIEVIKSERVALKAIEAVGLAQRPGLREAWLKSAQGVGDYLVWVAANLQSRLEVRPAKDSNVIGVSFVDGDPEFAARVANAVVRAYIDTTLELRVEPARQFSSFFDERAHQLRDTLEGAQRKLSDFQRGAGIVATDERFDVETARQNELSSQLVALQAVAQDTLSRRSAASSTPDRMTEALASPLLIALNTDLSRQESRLDEVRQRLGDAHPSVQQAQAAIAQVRERIDTERQRVTASVGVNSDVNQARLAALTTQVQAQQQKLLGLKRARDEMALLKRDVENAQRGYDAVYARINQSAMESQITQTNVSILKHASTPPLPSSPRPMLNGVAGLVLGVLLALGVVVARELADGRLRTDSDVELLLGQTSLGSLPRARIKARPPDAGRAAGMIPWPVK